MPSRSHGFEEKLFNVKPARAGLAEGREVFKDIFKNSFYPWRSLRLCGKKVF
jgi:hypothetical protein